MKVEHTKSGLPCLWEEGGGMSNTGAAIIIAGPHGEALKPVYIKRRGHLANGKHALFVVRPGTVIISLDHHRGDFYIKVSQVEGIQGDEAKMKTLAVFSRGEWDNLPPRILAPAILAGVNKATCYHCREPHWFSSEGTRMPSEDEINQAIGALVQKGLWPDREGAM